jgi:heme A synthase
MRTAYRILAYLVAAEVAVQAMVMVYAVAGLGKWVDQGGVLDRATFESGFEGGETPFTEFTGFLIHGINGIMVIPALALLLLIVSFFTRLRGAVKWAGLVLLLVVVQANLGFLGHEIPVAGALHGLNALLLFGAAFYAAHRVPAAAARRTVEPETRVPTGA